MSQTLRILVLEDRSTDAELIRYELRRQELQFEARQVMTEADFLSQLSSFQPHVILADYSLPGYDGFAALTFVQEHCPEVPFIFVSGTLGEETAIEALHHGATDYVLKERLGRLGPAVQRALREAQDRRERLQAEQHVAELNLLLRAIRGINRLIVRERDPLHLLGEACHLLVQTRSYRLAWIGLAQRESKQVLPVAKAGEGSHYLDSITVTWDEAPTGQGPVGVAMRTRQPWICDDTGTDARFAAWRELARTHRLVSVAAVPLIHGEHVLGALAVYSERKQAFVEEEIGLLSELAADLAFALQSIEDENERREGQARLHELAMLVENSSDFIATFTPAGQPLHINPAGRQLVGLEGEAQMRASRIQDYIAEADRPRFLTQTWPALVRDGGWEGETLFHNFKTGATIPMLQNAFFITEPASQRRLAIATICRDIRERKVLETQLRQAAKMEAVGQLAGGVAHDFNNVLSAVLIHLGLLRENPQLSPEVRESLKDLEKDTLRATGLTRQLLLFSRREVAHPKPVDLNEVISNFLKMVRRLLGENIQIAFQSPSQALWVAADAGMMEQVVMNLYINARDAMPRGGRLALSTRQVTLSGQQTKPEARPGSFVCLEVSDSGCGMDETVLKRIFEPFFTTKEAGKGTGLGLATVYGIVKQHTGWIEVESRVGQGSSFFVYLPALSQPAPKSATAASTQEVPRGTETILLVEDEQSLRRTTALCLRKLGYGVFEAGNGEEALRLWEQNRPPIDLLFTDMVMPGQMTGQELALRLVEEKPGLKVIISSGYRSGVGTHSAAAQQFTYLAKPYSAPTVARAVRRCLDGEPAAPYQGLGENGMAP